jgi:transglutaminase-like putative cysteine protease
MGRSFVLRVVPLLVGVVGLAVPGWCAQEKGPRHAARTFDFTYAATVTGLPPEKKARLWVPVPSSSDDQDVTIVGTQVKGGEKAKGRVATEKRYGNRVFFVETKPDASGKVALRFVYRVTRREVKGETGKKQDPPDRIARYLEADALVPITGKPLELIENKKLPRDPWEKARVLYDVVNGRLRYGKDRPGWGRGDSSWACDSRFGNCSDFHSLFISLARAQKIPAKFEIGFPLPEKRGSGAVAGYHCWAFFRPANRGWVPVDISEANKNPKRVDYFFGNLTPDRVAFSTGRDIDLVPRQAGKPLNFFIYPHVEIDGKEHPQGKIEKRFSFRDAR